jgi:hypothetical protein
MADNFTFTTTDAATPVKVTGNKERWDKTLWNITRKDIPFLNDIRKKDIDSIEWEWYVEKLNNPSAKASDGQPQNFTPSTSQTPRYKCVNYTMILQRAATVGETQEKQYKVGIKSEMRHQMFNHMIDMRKSVELRGLAGVGRRFPKAGDDGGVCMGFPGIVGRYGDSVLHVNGSTETYGTNNTVNIEKGEEDFEHSGAAVGFTKFKDRLQALWNLGSRPTRMVTSAVDKAFVSLWDTSGVTRESMKINEVEELVDVVKTDFGNVFVYPDDKLTKYANTGTFDGTSGAMVTDFAILYDPNMLWLCMYRDFFSMRLARTKDGETEYGAVEFTFEDAAPHGTAIFNFSGNSANSPTLGLFTTSAGYEIAYS